MNTNEWKDKLKAKVEGEGPLPAPSVPWEDLEVGMEGIERRLIVWRWAGAVAALAAVIIGIALFLPLNNPHTSAPSPVISETEPSLLVMADVSPCAITSSAQPKEDYVPETVADCEVETATDERNDEAQPHNVDILSENVSALEKQSDVFPILDDNASWDELERENASKPKHGRLSVGVGSGFTAGSNLNGNVDSPVASPGGLTDPTKPSTSQKESIILGFPVSFGVSARYAINDKFFVLGGLSVTTSKVESTNNLDGEMLWYLGPFAGLGVNLYQNANISAYTAATVNPDCCVNRTDLPILPSVNMSVGVQLRLGDVTWLYAEPRLKYTFPSENSTTKVSFNTPLQFSFNLGLRFQL